MKIHTIFPTAIGHENIISIPIEEHELMINSDYHKHEIYDMIVTHDKYILNKVPVIKNFIEQQLQQYAQISLATRQPLRITQSWCTKHENSKEYTFPHIHQNSIISGVYYIKADETTEGLTFYKDNVLNDRYITWKTDDDLMQAYNWNWHWETVKVKTGTLIMFPSQLKHAVNGHLEKQGNLRCSLAFNTWFDGNIGAEENFSRL